RTFWQLKNLSEFISMLTEIRPVEGLKVHLVTWEEEEKLPILIDDLDDIKDDLTNIGIDFTYEFKEFHDRCIKTDTGWIITLGRGLDIFEPYGKFSLGALQQSKRKCKDFSVNYFKEK
ncbi:MIT C-terminal domain-containing protein, partial [Parabacteroides johnsonii]